MSLLDWAFGEDEPPMEPILRPFGSAPPATPSLSGDDRSFLDDLLQAGQGAVNQAERNAFLRSMSDPAYSARFWNACLAAIGPAAGTAMARYVHDLLDTIDLVLDYYRSVYDPELWVKGVAVWTAERGADAEAIREVQEHFETYRYFGQLQEVIRTLPETVAAIATVVRMPRETIGEVVLDATVAWLQEFFRTHAGRPDAQGRQVGDLVGQAVAEYALFVFDLFVSPI